MNIRSIRRCVGALLLCLAVLACKDKPSQEEEPPAKPPREVRGLEAVPASVRVVVGANVAAIADSWLVQRAIGQMFLRDPGLDERIGQLIAECRFEPARDLRSLVIGLGSGADEDQAVMVATGKFVEADVARCVGKSLAADGGDLTSTPVEGRVFYHARGGSSREHSVWFTFGDAETLVVATSSEWLGKSVGKGDKVAAAQPMASWIARTDTDAGLWAAGAVDERIGKDLVALTEGQVAAAPRAMFGHVRLGSGMELELAALMTSGADAKSLLSLAKSQIGLASLALQRYGIGPYLSKLTVDATDDTVYVRFSLSEDELAQALARIDTTSGHAQDSPSGSDDPGRSKNPEAN